MSRIIPSLLRHRSKFQNVFVFRRSLSHSLKVVGIPVTKTLALSPAVAIFGFTIYAKAPDRRDLLVKADKLFEDSKIDELLTLLTSIDTWQSDNELLWRIARCKYHLSKKDEKNKNQLLRDSLAHVQRSLELDNQCGPAHKWAAILLDAASALDGTRARIEQTLNVRTHMEKSIELMPKDATAHYLLGEWHFSVAMTSWVEKKIASVIFATLPDADLETALKMFRKAEEIEPGFYSKNLVLMARTLITLDREKDTAKDLLIKVVHQYQNSEKWDDVEAVKEAKSLLGKLGHKV